MKLLKVMETVVMQFSAVVERVTLTHCSCYLTSCLATGQVVFFSWLPQICFLLQYLFMFFFSYLFLLGFDVL